MTVLYETEGEVAIVTINRPEARNAVDGPTAALLADAFRRFDADDSLAVAVLTGAQGAFCAGADLKAVATGRGNRTRQDGDGPMGPSRMLLGKPVIAAVEGHAVAGGLELALWCDMRVAARDAVFGVYCRRWGVPLVDGGTIRLPRLIGHSRALDMILTGRGISGDEALAFGLANRPRPRAGALPSALSPLRPPVFVRTVVTRPRRGDRERVPPRHRGDQLGRNARRRGPIRLRCRPSRVVRGLAALPSSARSWRRKGKCHVVAGLALGLLERPDGVDRPDRARLWRLGSVPPLQRHAKR
jgi:enoyl-CoA hydratase